MSKMWLNMTFKKCQDTGVNNLNEKTFDFPCAKHCYQKY